MLSDKQIQGRLAELKFSCSDPNFPFDQAKQIKSCTVDLRLADVVWRPKWFRYVDLAEGTPSGPGISNSFQRKALSSSGLLLRPGAFILARTYERFEIPLDLFGTLAGRSSIGRLGISVVAPSGTINPGWHGHMPLMLINHGPLWVRIRPYLSVVQLCLHELGDVVEKAYGEATEAKYSDDDGGPSKFWLDWSVKLLRDNLSLQTATEEVSDHLARFSAALDDETKQRFGKAVRDFDTVSDVDRFFKFFIDRERRRGALLPILSIAIAIALAFCWNVGPRLMEQGPLGYAAIALVLLVVFLIGRWIYATHMRTMFSANDLRKLVTETRRAP